MKYPTTTKVTIETNYGTCSTEINEVGISLPEMIESLVIPTLICTGYSEESVEKYRSIDD